MGSRPHFSEFQVRTAGVTAAIEDVDETCDDDTRSSLAVVVKYVIQPIFEDSVGSLQAIAASDHSDWWGYACLKECRRGTATYIWSLCQPLAIDPPSRPFKVTYEYTW